jgi:hypothetical protein
MRALLTALLLLVCLPAWSAGTPSGCARLCGKWVLDPAQSDSVAAVLDSALAGYKEPKPRRGRMPPPNDPLRTVQIEAEESIGPIFDRPYKDELRAELLALMKPPVTLSISEMDDEVILQGTGPLQRRVAVGRAHSRVDSLGTAKIRVSWKADALIISESYDRKRNQVETFALRKDGTLLVTQQVQRPGTRPIKVRTFYRRG